MALLNQTVVTAYSWAVTWRQYVVWKKLIWSSLATNVVNPLLFLFAFGFGLGAFIDTMDGYSYIAFVVPGMVAYSAMFAASFETTIGSFSRYYMQRTWDAVLASPVSLLEMLFGEVLWAALKAMISAIPVYIIGALWGGIDSYIGALITLPIVFCASLAFASYGMVATAYARGYEFFSYFFSFWITPSFIFAGVFFAIERFPVWVQAIAWVLPMTHFVALIRPLTAGAPLDPVLATVNVVYIVATALVAFIVAHARIRARMFD